MQWFIIGRDMHVLCTPSTDLPETLPIDDSGDSLGQEIAITNDCAVGTYDFTTDPRHEDSVYITEGNYIAFRDKYGKDRLYTIMTIEGDDEWTVHCEDIGLDLINEYAEPWDYTARSIEDTLKVVLNDTGWEIGINEVASYKRATKFEGTTDSQLARIGDVCNQFDAECDFAIEMKGSKVTKQVLNIYKTLGEDKTQQRFIDNINLISLSRSGSIEDLITCLRCYGKEDENGNKLTIANITYDDGRYYSPKGHIRIYDREARQKWSRYRAFNYQGQGEFEGYINGTFEYDTDDPQELLNRGLTELKSKNDVKVSYEANLYDLRADIGDTVQIADNSKAEKVYLSARIQSVRNHYTVSGEDTGTLANYKILVSKPTSQVSQILDQLKDQIVSVKSTDISYQIGDSGVEPPTGQWVPNPPQTSPGQYLWTRKITTYSNDSQTTEYSVSRNGDNGKDGEDGEQGPPGQDGRGVRSTSVSYQSSTSGTTIPTGVWSDSVPSVSAGQYLWTRTVIEYTDNTSSTLYSVSRMGGNGTDGKGITSITEYYLASASSSGVTTSTSGWTTSIQTITESKKYLWNYEVTRYTDGTSTTTSPCIIGVYGNTGATGNGIKSITNYYLATSAGSGVTTDTSGWTTTIQTISASKKYLWNYEVVTYTNGNTSETAPHIIGVYGDQGPQGKPGDNGVDGSDGVSMFLSNESMALPCDIEGNPIDYTPATGTAYLYKGSDDVSASATWSVTWSGMNGTFSSSTRVYKVTSMTEDVGKLTIKAVYQGSTLTKIFTVTKALKNIKVNSLSAISAVLGKVETGEITNKVNGKNAVALKENAVEFYDYTNSGEFCGRIRGSKRTSDGIGKTIRLELETALEAVAKTPSGDYSDLFYAYQDGFGLSIPLYYFGRDMGRVFGNIPEDTIGAFEDFIKIVSLTLDGFTLNAFESKVLSYTAPTVPGYKNLGSIGVKGIGNTGLMGSPDSSWVVNATNTQRTWTNVTVYFLYQKIIARS